MTANVSYLALVVINFTRAQKLEKSPWVDLQEEDVGEQHSPQAGARGKSCAGQKTWSCRRLEKRLATRRGSDSRAVISGRGAWMAPSRQLSVTERHLVQIYFWQRLEGDCLEIRNVNERD